MNCGVGVLNSSLSGSLLHCTSHTSQSLKAWLSLVSNACQQLLDLSDGLAGVKTLGAGLGAVHDGVASVDREGVPQLVQPGCLLFVPGINDPAVGLHEDCRAQVLVSIPPVGRAGGRAARAQDALIQAVKLCPVINRLKVLLGNFTLHLLSLKPGLDASVLLVEVVHVRHQVLHHIHVGQGVDLCCLVVCIDLRKAGKGVHSTNVHCTGATDALPTAPPESEAGVHLILDLDEGVQHHGAAVVQVHLVLLHPGLVSRLFGVPSVDGKGLLLLRPQAPCSLLLSCCCLRCSPDCCIEGRAGGEAKKLGCCVDCHGSSCTTDSLL